MSDTRQLLTRISAFRDRLAQVGHLVPGDDDPDANRVADALMAAPGQIGHALRLITPQPSGAPPLPLTLRARRLLEDARALVHVQRNLAADPALSAALAGDGDDAHALHHRDTVALTEAALKLAQVFPAAAEAQLRACDGLEMLLQTVRDRLAVLRAAVLRRRVDTDRLDGLARRLADIHAGRMVDLTWFADLAHALLDEAGQAAPLRFLTADPDSTCSYIGGRETVAPARFVAAHALTVAQVVARVVPHDYEWAGRGVTAVMAALVMDLGMVGIPVEVLSKAGPLSPADRRLVDAHPERGAEMIRAIYPDSDLVAAAVAAHHERPDGTGYPAAAVGDEISSLARLLGVCDHYAGLCGERPHRPAADPRTALTETLFAAEAGRVDRDFSELLLHLSMFPVGAVVELSDGRVGVVVANHASRVNLRAAARPVVAVVADPDGNVLPRPDHIDLAAADRGSVVRALPRAERSTLLARHYPELCG